MLERSSSAPPRTPREKTRSHRDAVSPYGMTEKTTRSWQTHWHHHPGVRSGSELSFGERAADRMRNAMGSWPFVFAFFAVMASWAIINTFVLQRALHHRAFDPYPYILLNLFLSMLAGVQAAALLIAAKRSDAVASEVALHTANNTDDIKTLIQENTELTAAIKHNTDLLDEIHRHLTELGTRLGAPGGSFDPPPLDATPPVD